jgi:hypothetical protein
MTIARQMRLSNQPSAGRCPLAFWWRSFYWRVTRLRSALRSELRPSQAPQAPLQAVPVQVAFEAVVAYSFISRSPSPRRTPPVLATCMGWPAVESTAVVSSTDAVLHDSPSLSSVLYSCSSRGEQPSARSVSMS